MSVYYRVGPTNRKADPEMIDELKRSVMNKYFDEQPMAELDSEAIDFRFASEFFKTRKELNGKDLETLEILVEHHRKKPPTVDGMILFGLLDWFSQVVNYFPNSSKMVGPPLIFTFNIPICNILVKEIYHIPLEFYSFTLF